MLKTKIVATIGNHHSYRDGIIDLNGTKIPPDKITPHLLVDEFCRLGVDLIRMNLAHIETSAIKSVFFSIKSALLEYEQKSGGKRIAVLADLPGPKIRFHLKRRVCLKTGDTFSIHFEREISSPTAATVYVDDKPLKEAMKSGFRRMMEQIGKSLETVWVVVGDGEVALKVVSVGDDGASISCRVINAKKSEIVGNKGFTLKGVDVDIPSFTETDRLKLDQILQAEFAGNPAKSDPVAVFVGLSFTQTENDVLRLKEHIETWLRHITGVGQKIPAFQAPSIIAKIETRLGCRNIDHILDVADGIMVARGDLGLQMDIEEVPALQKRLIQLSNKRGKPVITATEMLKSMTAGMEPTRAEATDVFNAILDGSDAVMTSEETACGLYPFHALRKMESIAVQAENFFEMKDSEENIRRSTNLKRYQEFLQDDYARIQENSRRLEGMVARLGDRTGSGLAWGGGVNTEWCCNLYKGKIERSRLQPTTNRITQAACTMSESTEVKCIIAATASGRTARMISRLKPSVIIVGASHDVVTTRKLTISYGVIPLYIGALPVDAGTDDLFNRCREAVKVDHYLERLLKAGDLIVFTAGTPPGTPGTTNLIQMKHI